VLIQSLLTKTEKDTTNMEALIIGWIAINRLYRQEEKVLPETETLKPLNLQALRYLNHAKGRPAGQRADRNDAPLASAVS
jgi:hypothetical protein